MLYSGIDLHKRTIAIHTDDAVGALVRKADLPTNRAAITAYFTTLAGPRQAVCECTGLWYWVRDLLVPQGIDLRLAHAKYLKAISYAKVKTDAVDAATMAQLLRVQLIPEAHMMSDTHREVRDLLRARLLLVTRMCSASAVSAPCSSVCGVPAPPLSSRSGASRWLRSTRRRRQALARVAWGHAGHGHHDRRSGRTSQHHQRVGRLRPVKLLLDTHIWLWALLDPDRFVTDGPRGARVGRIRAVAVTDQCVGSAPAHRTRSGAD